MENGGKKITRIKLYACGYCQNDLGIVFHGHERDVRKFPALVVYLHHAKFGNILFDTGYSELVYKNGFVSFIYNSLNKTFVEPSEIIDVRLRNDGISPDSIKYIIISIHGKKQKNIVKNWEGILRLSMTKKKMTHFLII